MVNEPKTAWVCEPFSYLEEDIETVVKSAWRLHLESLYIYSDDEIWPIFSGDLIT